MNMLLNFVDIRSRIEFLSAVVYFVFAFYLLFLLFINKSIPEKERKLIYIISYGFIAIFIMFALRQIVHQINTEFRFDFSWLSASLFIILLVLPVQFYCCQRVDSTVLQVKHFLIALGVILTANIYELLLFAGLITLNEVFSSSLLYVIIAIYLVCTGLMIVQFFNKIFFLKDHNQQSIINYKNDIFIFLVIVILSFFMIVFKIFEAKPLYIRAFLYVFTGINFLLFFKVSLPFNFVKNLHDFSISQDHSSLQSERHKINRQLSDSLKADDLYERLLKYFEKEKPYLKADLKIREVALYLYSNKTYLSRIINDKNNLNFNQFVNYYRIEEVKQLFKENNKLNIQELCYMSGFGSMATFSIAFRYHLGYTPADWCKEQKLKLFNG